MGGDFLLSWWGIVALENKKPRSRRGLHHNANGVIALALEGRGGDVGAC